jgi:prenylcysteine oxidase/farnesylcysteine lyase
METETVSSRNVVDLLLNEEFGSGICGQGLANERRKDGGFVLGWDC